MNWPCMKFCARPVRDHYILFKKNIIPFSSFEFEVVVHSDVHGTAETGLEKEEASGQDAE